jgi:hypothetical protein
MVQWIHLAIESLSSMPFIRRKCRWNSYIGIAFGRFYLFFALVFRHKSRRGRFQVKDKISPLQNERHHLPPIELCLVLVSGHNAPPSSLPCHTCGPFSSSSIEHLKHHWPPWNVVAIDCDFTCFVAYMNSKYSNDEENTHNHLSKKSKNR